MHGGEDFERLCEETIMDRGLLVQHQDGLWADLTRKVFQIEQLAKYTMSGEPHFVLRSPTLPRSAAKIVLVFLFPSL